MAQEKNFRKMMKTDVYNFHEQILRV